MTAPTHIVFGIFSTTGLFSLMSLSLHKDLPAVGAAILGSLLPDLDSPKSSLGRLLPFISVPLERRWGHRTITHGLAVLFGLAMVLMPLYWLYPTLYAALLIGYMSHLLADCMTLSGVPLFYPSPSVYVLPGNPRFRVKTGSLAERGVLLVLILLLALIAPLSNLGGVWRAMRYLIGTQQMAYTEYRAATKETKLLFKGRWQTSRLPVEGEALILEGSTTRFLIGFKDQVWVYGEQGDILPDRSRVESTGRPLVQDSLVVEEQPFSQILEQIPAGTYVSGQLVCEQPFALAGLEDHPQTAHTWIAPRGTSITLAYAPRARLASIRLNPIHNPEQREQHAAQLRALQAQVRDLQLQRPPVHHDQLRPLTQKIQDHQAALKALQDPQRLFSGGLSWRRAKEDR